MLQLLLDVQLAPAKPESWGSAQIQEDVGSQKGGGGSLARECFLPDVPTELCFSVWLYSSPIWPETDHSLRPCQHFYVIFFHFCSKFLVYLDAATMKVKREMYIGMWEVFSGLLFIF